LDISDAKALRKVAEIHQRAPLAWNPAFNVREEEIAGTEREIREAGVAGAQQIFLAWIGPEIIGMHWVGIEEKHGQACLHLRSLWVHEEFRGRGIARTLKQKGEVWGKSRGAGFVFTEVFYANKYMIEYNLKLGFEARQVEMHKRL
jgi:GNAT superfamily N-acetyltransferase